MLGFIKKIFGSSGESKSTAKSRLHFVLVQDRTGLSNDQMAKFRGELVEVIQRYFIIDEQGFDIDYERSGETTKLIINSPVVVRRQEALNGVAGARPLSAASSGPSTSARSGGGHNKKRRRKAGGGSDARARSKRGAMVNI
ncbi:MAG: cell division topological specificity factor MinE [Bdellovibrionales bacterium]|nr:cell division topological specificity factor MinE [Bdellovibrionales bacterium]